MTLILSSVMIMKRIYTKGVDSLELDLQGVHLVYLVLFLNHPYISKSWFSSSASPARVQLGPFNP